MTHYHVRLVGVTLVGTPIMMLKNYIKLTLNQSESAAYLHFRSKLGMNPCF